MQTFGQVLVIVVPLVLSIMNLVWFSKIIKGLRKTLAKRQWKFVLSDIFRKMNTGQWCVVKDVREQKQLNVFGSPVDPNLYKYVHSAFSPPPPFMYIYWFNFNYIVKCNVFRSINLAVIEHIVFRSISI